MCVSDWVFIVVLGILLSLLVTTVVVNAVWWIGDTLEERKRRRYEESLEYAEKALARAISDAMERQEEERFLLRVKK